MKTQETTPVKTFSDTWNAMVWFINNTTDEQQKAYAKMLMSQRNTASGKRMEGELVFFLSGHGISINPLNV